MKRSKEVLIFSCDYKADSWNYWNSLDARISSALTMHGRKAFSKSERPLKYQTNTRPGCSMAMGLDAGSLWDHLGSFEKLPVLGIPSRHSVPTALRPYLIRKCSQSPGGPPGSAQVMSLCQEIEPMSAPHLVRSLLGSLCLPPLLPPLAHMCVLTLPNK